MAFPRFDVLSARYALNRPLDAFDPDGLMICAGTPGVPCAVNNGNTQLNNENGGTPLNPIVQANLANPPVNGVMDLGGCAEPRYLSDHLNNYRPPITNDNDPRLKGALDDFKAQAYDGNPKRKWQKHAPCPTCSQLFANLMSKYGAPQQHRSSRGHRWQNQPHVNFTPPRGGRPGWGSYNAALAHFNANN